MVRYSIAQYVAVWLLMIAPVVAFSQSISGLSPNTGVAGQGLTVTITGVGTTFMLATGTNSGWLQQGSTVYPLNLNVQSNTQIGTFVNFACSDPQGAYDFYYTDTDPSTPYDTLSLANAYTVSGTQAGNFSPTSGTQCNSLSISLTSGCSNFTLSSSTHTGWLDNGVDQTQFNLNY